MVFLLLVKAALALAVAPPSGSAAHPSPGERRFEQQCVPMRSGWRRHGCQYGELVDHNSIRLQRNRLLWNDRAISEPKLRKYLHDVVELNPQPAMVLIVDKSTDVSKAAQIRRLMQSTLHCGLEHTCVEYTATAWRDEQRKFNRPNRR